MEAVQRWEHVEHSGHAAVPPKTALFEKYEGPDSTCICGCPKSAHMGLPRGCGKHAFHEFDLSLPHARSAPEPPLTPEEEEEAPEDSRCMFCWHSESQHNLLAQTCTVNDEASRCGCERFRTEPEDSQCTCGQTACESELCDCDSAPCPVDHASEAAEAAEAALNDDWAPPQPERRAPYVATYSVGGHLYEVAVPGDACLQAVDGALVIRHGLGPVAGLVGFQPLTMEEKA